MIEGLIFDMDGTMVDNMMMHHRAWQRKLASLGIEMTLAQVKEHIHGVNEEILERLFGDRFTPEERKRIAWEKEAEYREIFADQLTLIPGLETFLMSVRTEGLSMAIGTAAPPENVDFVLDHLSLRPYFQAVIHARHVTRGKPDPQTFTLAAESMGIAVENCLVFEDSLAGAETAKNAGCRAIIITTTHHRDEFRKFDHILRFITDYTEISLTEILSNST